MRRLFISLAIIFFPVCLKSQDLQLQDCIRESLIHNPLSANKELAIQIAEVKKRIIKSAWFPSLDLNGQATWQSDVVVLNLDLPFPVNFPKIPKDQYRITTDISQIIYDGGNIKNQQILEDINSDLSVQELEIKEFELKQTVEDLFFAILVTEKRVEVLDLMAQSLKHTINQVESGVKNGILSESDLPVVLAEQIKIDQQLISLKGLKLRAANTLGLLMGKEITPETHFVVPVDLNETSLKGERPELQVFELQDNMLEARKTLLNAQLRPRIMAFGQAGYGKPGLNFMGDKWDPYLLVGLKGTWNVWDWGKVQQQKESLSLNQRVIANQQESFTIQITQAEQNQQLVINEINALLLKDGELLSNREKVTVAYSSRLTNGLITASQFINEWTREQEVRINLEVRKIELISSAYKLLSIKGKY
ncbi:MAG: TolC family protein [Porphyromonadaceae bacterium]|nr:MAG: TolC family protein [Porphyromonadaceae bacterium]